MAETGRIRAWLDRTHSVGFELLRHFLARFFDSEMSGAGEWRKVAIGVFAAMISFSILAFDTFLGRYNYMLQAGLSDTRILQEVRADELMLVGLAMALTAILAILQWQSLFPSLRDYLALAGLPVKPRQIFLAKSGALLLLFAVYVLTLNTVPAAFFGFVTSGRAPFGIAFASMAGACAFVFFTLLAVQGVLLNLLPPRLFARVSLVFQAVVFMATVGALPLVLRQPQAAWWPPLWFVLSGAPSLRPALLAVAIPPIVAALAYLASYHRYRRLLLEAAPAQTAARERGGIRLSDWIRDPRQQAAFSFIWKTLGRSRIHRLMLMAYGGLALGWITKGVLDTPRVSLRDQGVYGLLVALAPLAVAILTVLGLRYLFSLPVALPSNWLFQTTGRDGRRAWFAAVERFVVWCGIAPVFAASLPPAIAILGPVRAAAATALTLAAALICFERLFRDWRKLPFTCSYLPGKQPAWVYMLRAGIVMPLLAAFGQLALTCSAALTPFVALFTFELALWWRLRVARRRAWDTAPLQFEEIDEGPVMSLDLRPADHFETTTAPPPPVVDLFSDSLVASRGFLPQSWREEIATDGRSPAALLDTFLEDLRYGLRLIRRSPVFSAVVVLTLTVGIGINASVFTVVSGLALRPHVYKDPASFLRIIPENLERTRSRPASFAEYRDWQKNSRTVRQLAAYTYARALVGDDDSTGSNAMAVSCNFFLVDGLDRPIAGRLLTPDDCLRSGQPPVAIINETLWRTRFAADSRAVGRVAHINNRPVTIVGVVPDRTATWTRPASLWMPYTAQSYFDPARNVFDNESFLWLSLAGRLAPGYSRSQAEAEFNILAAQTRREHSGRGSTVVTTDGAWMDELYLGLSGRQLMLLGFFMGAFNLVLLISCANVATLLLSRAATRRREIAVRLSLGAPRIRLVRMLVTESVLLAAIAGAFSLYLVRHVPEPLFRAVASKSPSFPMPPDWRTFAYIAAIVITTGILSGLAPALESVNVDLASTLKGAATRFGGDRLRGALVAAQVALSMVLLVGAALFAQSEDRNLRGNPGYAPQRVVVAPLAFPENLTLEAAASRMKALEARILALPGAHSVAFSERLPMIGHDTVELRPPARPDATQPVDIYDASPRFLETMGVALAAGRDFEATDRRAVIVSRSLERMFWPRTNPIGERLALPEGDAVVIGVARDVEPLRFGGSENPVLYRVYHGNPEFTFLSARFDAGVSAAAPAVRSAIHRTYPDMIAMSRVLQGWIDEITEELWNVVALILILGLVATVLATTGIYGAVSFAVNQRTRELGIRVALGAQRLDIVREVLFAGGKPVLQGLLIGLWLSAATAAGLGQSVRGSPLRLDTTNPLLYVAAALLLGLAALVAMIAPARRGAKSDPLDALRCE